MEIIPSQGLQERKPIAGTEPCAELVQTVALLPNPLRKGRDQPRFEHSTAKETSAGTGEYDNGFPDNVNEGRVVTSRDHK